LTTVGARAITTFTDSPERSLDPGSGRWAQDLAWRRGCVIPILGDDQQQSGLVECRARGIHRGADHLGNVDGMAEKIAADRGIGDAQGHQRRNYS
jgi:hypothetical protein